MKNVRELLRLGNTSGDFGVEIEVEGKGLVPLEDGVWTSHDDGSLRGVFPDSRCEYVLAKPLNLEQAKMSIQSLRAFLDDNKSKMEFSFRTSVHVHMNVQKLKWPEYLALIYTYLILEDAMLTYCGKERKGNRFCLRLQDAEGLQFYLWNMFKVNGVQQLAGVRAGDIRYSSLNIAATQKYGSLEFRGMRGNMDVEVLSTWLDILHRIRAFAVKQGSPIAVYNTFIESQDFLTEVLGDKSVAVRYPRWEEDMKKNFSLTLDLPHTYARNVEEVRRQEELLKKEGGKASPDLDKLKAAYRAFLMQGYDPHAAGIRAQEYVVANPEWNPA